MRYLGMAPMAQDALLADLQAMPDYLAATFAGLSAADAAVPGPDGALARAIAAGDRSLPR